MKISSRISISKLINSSKMSQSVLHQLVELQSSCHSSTRIDVVDFYDDRSHTIIAEVENQYNCLIFFTVESLLLSNTKSAHRWILSRDHFQIICNSILSIHFICYFFSICCSLSISQEILNLFVTSSVILLFVSSWLTSSFKRSSWRHLTLQFSQSTKTSSLLHDIFMSSV